MNVNVEYRKKNTSWGSVLLLKARELSNNLVGKRKTMGFQKPAYEIERHDTDEIRKKILEISCADWKKQGYSKGTLHQLKQKSKQMNLLLSISILEKDLNVGGISFWILNVN